MTERNPARIPSYADGIDALHMHASNPTAGCCAMHDDYEYNPRSKGLAIFFSGLIMKKMIKIQSQELLEKLVEIRAVVQPEAMNSLVRRLS